MEELLAGNDAASAAAATPPPYDAVDDLLAPLTAIYWSLWECGSGIIAEGRLLDLIRRVAAFGLCLMRIDLRQDAARHTAALDAVTAAIGAPSYAAMDEPARVAFLAAELAGRRPLIPRGAQLPPDDAEVVDTFRVAAALGPTSLGAYVISMATQPSDVLAVQLLMREAALSADPPLPPAALRVVPLFETLADLDGAGASLDALLGVPWYRDHVAAVHGNHQEVMVRRGNEAGAGAFVWPFPAARTADAFSTHTPLSSPPSFFLLSSSATPTRAKTPAAWPPRGPCTKPRKRWWRRARGTASP